MTRTDFSALAGVSRAAVTQAVKRGLLEPLPDGSIDESSSSAVLYLQSQRVKLPHADDRGHEQKKRKQLPPEIPLLLPDPEHIDIETADLDGIDFDHPERYLEQYGHDLAARDKAAQTIKRLVEIKRHQQAYRKESGTLIERDYVAGRFASFSEALRQQLLTTPRRVAAQTVARARSDGERAVEEYLADEIGVAIDRALQELAIE